MLTLVATEEGLTRLDFGTEPPAEAGLVHPGEHPVLSLAAGELAAYFAGRLRTFTVPLAPAGTAFQLQAWAYLREIPFGQTRSYGQQARALDAPAATRAVGRANGQNPVGVIVPCHRVVGATGRLTGYAGGIERKAWLLEHERAVTGTGLFG